MQECLWSARGCTVRSGGTNQTFTVNVAGATNNPNCPATHRIRPGSLVPGYGESYHYAHQVR